MHTGDGHLSRDELQVEATGNIHVQACYSDRSLDDPDVEYAAIEYAELPVRCCGSGGC